MQLRLFLAFTFIAYSRLSLSQENTSPEVPDVSASQSIAPRIDPQNCRLPAYPANETMVPGVVHVVRLSIVVDENGKTLQVEIRRSAGYASFDQEAVKAFSSCNFFPATQNGVPVTARFSIDYKWPAD